MGIDNSQCQIYVERTGCPLTLGAHTWPCQLTHQQNLRHITDHASSARFPAHAGTAQQHLQRGQSKSRIIPGHYANLALPFCELTDQKMDAFGLVSVKSILYPLDVGYLDVSRILTSL